MASHHGRRPQRIAACAMLMSPANDRRNVSREVLRLADEAVNARDSADSLAPRARRPRARRTLAGLQGLKSCNRKPCSNASGTVCVTRGPRMHNRRCGSPVPRAELLDRKARTFAPTMLAALSTRLQSVETGSLGVAGPSDPGHQGSPAAMGAVHNSDYPCCPLRRP